MDEEREIAVMVVVTDGRMRRMAQFEAVEEAMKPLLMEFRSAGIRSELSPIIKTPAEVLRGSPLFLDMTMDARLLHDVGGFMQLALDKLKAKLDNLGARRIYRGNAWFWDLSPDFKPGDIIE